jgi:hypothetical protein
LIIIGDVELLQALDQFKQDGNAKNIGNIVNAKRRQSSKDRKGSIDLLETLDLDYLGNLDDNDDDDDDEEEPGYEYKPTPMHRNRANSMGGGTLDMEDFLGTEFETGGDVPVSLLSASSRGSSIGIGGIGSSIGNGTRRASFDRVTPADIYGRQRHDSLGSTVGFIGVGSIGFNPVFDFGSSGTEDSIFGTLGSDPTMSLKTSSPKRISFTVPESFGGDSQYAQAAATLPSRLISSSTYGFGSSTDFGNPIESSSDIYQGGVSSGSSALPGGASGAGAGAGGDTSGFIGAYTPAERKERIARFIEKRSRRVWTKKVKYDVRKNFADSRIRVKGRFVKKEDEEVLRELLSL